MPYADNEIEFKIEGPGVLAGTDNGSQTSLESFQSPKRKSFHGKCLLVVRTTEEKGIITITASAKGLMKATTRIETTATVLQKK